QTLGDGVAPVLYQRGDRHALAFRKPCVGQPPHRYQQIFRPGKARCVYRVLALSPCGEYLCLAGNRLTSIELWLSKRAATLCEGQPGHAEPHDYGELALQR